MIYNQKKHIELLKLSQSLENQGKRLSHENPQQDFELSKYNATVSTYILWESRDKIVLLMKDFLDKKINGEEFCDGVYGLRREHINSCKEFLKLMSNSEKVKNFQPDERSKRLSSFFTALYCECEHFEDDYNSAELYNSIQNGFLNFQKAFNEE